MATDKILVTDDISAFSAPGRKRSNQIRNLAANISKALQAELHYLYVEDIPERLRKKATLGTLEKRNPQLVTKLVNRLKTINDNIQFHLDSGAPIQKILSWADKLDPKMIVLGTRGMRGLGKFLLGSTAEEVVRQSSIPVVVVGPKVTNVGFGFSDKKKRILLLTDLSSASIPAETFAIALAKATKSSVTIFHSVGDSIKHIKDSYYSTSFPIPLYPIEPIVTDLRKWARTQLAKKGQGFRDKGINVKTRFVTEEREIIHDIKKELDGDYNLVIMGTHSRNNFLKAFLGSTARKTCLNSKVPVVIVKSNLKNKE